jgi:DNA-binding NarL/FixJ family response regulator
VTEPIRIAVVDDHQLFRDGLVELLQTVTDLQVTEQGATGPEAIALAERAKPDVVVLDVELPGEGPAATIKAIRMASPATRIVILTMHDDPALILELIDAGASAYLLKSADRLELATAIRRAARRDDTVLVAVARSSVLGLARQTRVSTVSPISIRESEVITLLSQAKSSRDIAKALYISEGTVKRHLTNIYGKLGAKSRLDAVRKAQELGLL